MSSSFKTVALYPHMVSYNHTRSCSPPIHPPLFPIFTPHVHRPPFPNTGRGPPCSPPLPAAPPSAVVDAPPCCSAISSSCNARVNCSCVFVQTQCVETHNGFRYTNEKACGKACGKGCRKACGKACGKGCDQAAWCLVNILSVFSSKRTPHHHPTHYHPTRPPTPPRTLVAFCGGIHPSFCTVFGNRDTTRPPWSNTVTGCWSTGTPNVVCTRGHCCMSTLPNCMCG